VKTVVNSGSGALSGPNHLTTDYADNTDQQEKPSRRKLSKDLSPFRSLCRRAFVVKDPGSPFQLSAFQGFSLVFIRIRAIRVIRGQLWLRGFIRTKPF
jgi:hypothetical protein